MPNADYATVPDDEALRIRQGTQSLWFTRLMEGTMLDMKSRPQLTKAQQIASSGMRMRAKQHAVSDEGYNFYVWLEPLSPTDAEEQDDEMPEPPEG